MTITKLKGMQPIIRLAKKEDTPAILAIYEPFILDSAASFEYEVPSVAAFWKRIEKVLADTPWLVCEINGQIAGYAYASPHRGRTAYQWSREVSTYINADFRKRGIASALYIALIEILKIQGYQNILAGITQPNPASEIFHQNFGFKKIGTFEKVGYKFEKWWDTNWYQLFIGKENETPLSPKAMAVIIDSVEWQQGIAKGLERISNEN